MVEDARDGAGTDGLAQLQEQLYQAHVEIERLEREAANASAEAAQLTIDLAQARAELATSGETIVARDEEMRLLRAQVEDLNWCARELARLPFDFTVRAPAALRSALSRAGQRLARLAESRGK